MREADRSDVDLVLRLYDLRREPEMRKARTFVMSWAPQTIEDVRALMDWAHPENAHLRQVVSYWEMVADFAARGLLHPEMFASHCGEGIIVYLKFERFRDEIRQTANPRFLGNLERAITTHEVIGARAQQLREMLAKMAAQRK